MSDVKLVSKLSLKSLKAQPPKASLAEGDAYDIAVIYGIAGKAEAVQTSFGDSTRFVGDFKGKNIATGEVQRSSKVFLPGIVEEMLANAIEEADGANIEFGFIVGVEFSEKGSMGYAYTVKPVMQVKESDALKHLEDSVEAKLKALPAPAKAEHAAPVDKGSKKK